jgi:small ligand-binding sensory domain FIST
MPSTGFFCNGEIGPVGNASYLHGYTASVALFCE